MATMNRSDLGGSKNLKSFFHSMYGSVAVILYGNEVSTGEKQRSLLNTTIA